jgi:hypothetical protein
MTEESKNLYTAVMGGREWSRRRCGRFYSSIRLIQILKTGMVGHLYGGRHKRAMKEL